MRHPRRLALLIGLFLLALFPHAGPPAVASPRASGTIVATEKTFDDLASNGRLTTQRGGAINAPDAGSSGAATLLFSSNVIDAGQLFDRVGVHWRAKFGTENSFFVELRTSADSLNWSDWQLLVAEEDMANVFTNEWYASPQQAVDHARYAQYRIWLTAGEPKDVAKVGMTFMDVTDLNAGPVARLVNDIIGAAKDVARSFTEPAVTIAAPVGATRILSRTDWAADENLMRWVPRYYPVKKAVVHHTVTDDGGSNVGAAIRAIYYFHAVTRGWGDIGYSYIVDKYGNVWTGRQGGDGTEGGHAYGWNKGSIGIAALGTYSVTSPTPAMVGAIANIIATKFSQFDLQPFGADQFVHEEQAPDGSWAKVSSNPPNVQGHRDCNYIQSQYGGQTACPGNALYSLLPQIRSMAQNAVQQGYVQMPYLDTNLPRASFPGGTVNVSVTVLNKGRTNIPAGTAVSYRILQGANTVVSQGGATPVPSDIAPGSVASVNVPLVVPAIGNYIVRWDLQSNGIWWNALYGTPWRDQYFRGADWSADWVTDNVPNNWTAGESKIVSVTVTNDGGRVWNATGAGPVKLGYKWVSSATGNTFPSPDKMPLPSDVQPGQTVTLTMPVIAPVYPTNYTMFLDLYKENEFAFADKGIAPDDTPTGVSVDFKAGYTFGSQPQFTSGQTATVPVTITNQGRGTFPVTSSFPVNLGYHWTTPTGAAVIWDGARTKLPADLLSGQSVTVNAGITAPSSGGSYLLKLDLVQEGVSWFSTKGAATGNMPVSLAGPFVASFGGSYAPASAPSGMAGTRTTLPITIANTSNFTWSSGGANPVNLSYHWWSTTLNRTVLWEGVRTPLGGDVAPGASVTVQGNVAFPATPGNYLLRWDLVQEGVSWFSGKGVATGDQFTVVSPYVTPFFGGSLDVSRTPATMGARLVTTVPLRVQNLSNFDWGSNVNLSYHWLDASGRVVAWDGLRTSLAGIRVNQVSPVNAQIAVPAALGTYTLRYDIVQEGVTWFSGAGMQTPQATVTVTQPQYGAVYMIPSPQVAATPGSTISVPVNVMNVGTNTWASGVVNLSYHIYGPSGEVVTWDGARTTLPMSAVAPNQTISVNAQVVAPTTPGTYTIGFDLVEEGKTWFSQQGVATGSVTLQAR